MSKDRPPMYMTCPRPCGTPYIGDGIREENPKRILTHLSVKELRDLYVANKQALFHTENNLKEITAKLKYMENCISNGSRTESDKGLISEVRSLLGLDSKAQPQEPETTQDKGNDPVDHPLHYTSHPSGVECITVTRHMDFQVGNAVKYLWRCGLKGGSDSELQDLKKAAWYINDKIKQLESEAEKKSKEPRS